MSSRRLALVLAVPTAGVLLVMVGVSLATGATQEIHEHYLPPADYARDLLAHPGGLRALIGLDVAFLVLYTAFFIALSDHLRGSGRMFWWLALAAMITTALLDVIEDHHILALLALAEHGRPIDDGSLVFQEVVSQSKFTVSYLALVLYGLAIPRTTRLGWALALFLTAGTLVTGALGYAAPADIRAALDNGRWVGFLGGFGLAAAWLRRSPEPAAPPPAAAGGG